MKPDRAKQREPKVPKTPPSSPLEEKKAAESLAKPPKDKREITIAPNKSVGPDISLD